MGLKPESWPFLRARIVEMTGGVPDHVVQAGVVPESRIEEARPVYLAMVDLSCNEEFLEVVQTSLLAALEALPSVARFGLVTFSNKVHKAPQRPPPPPGLPSRVSVLAEHQTGWRNRDIDH